MRLLHLQSPTSAVSDEPFQDQLEALGDRLILLIGNKLDVMRESAKDTAKALPADMIAISSKTNAGIKQLREAILERIEKSLPDFTSGVVVTSARHKQKLSSALKSLKSARKKIMAGESPELTAFDLREAVNAIDEITGKVYNEDILGRIFSKFCIGK